MSDLPSMLVPLVGQFPGWPSSEAPSAVETLVFVVFLPLAISAVILVIVMAGNLSRRSRGEALHVQEPLWVGQTSQTGVEGTSRAALGSSETPRSTADRNDIDPTTGGASVRW